MPSLTEKEIAQKVRSEIKRLKPTQLDHFLDDYKKIIRSAFNGETSSSRRDKIKRNIKLFIHPDKIQSNFPSVNNLFNDTNGAKIDCLCTILDEIENERVAKLISSSTDIFTIIA